MKEIILQTYGIVLPIVLGYIVWLLKEQKKRQQKDAIERNKRIADENEETGCKQCRYDAASSGAANRVPRQVYEDRFYSVLCL